MKTSPSVAHVHYLNAFFNAFATPRASETADASKRPEEFRAARERVAATFVGRRRENRRPRAAA